MREGIGSCLAMIMMRIRGDGNMRGLGERERACAFVNRTVFTLGGRERDACVRGRRVNIGDTGRNDCGYKEEMNKRRDRSNEQVRRRGESGKFASHV